MRLSKIPGVERARLTSGSGVINVKTRSVKEKCSSEIMLDESAVNTLNVLLFSLPISPPAYHRLRHGPAAHAARQSRHGIRGRLHLKTSNVLMVGSSVLLAPSLSDGLVLRERPHPLPRAGFPSYGRLNAHLVRVPRGLLCAAE